MDFVIQHSYLIPLLPLIGAIIAGLFGARTLKQQSHWPIWLGVGASAVMALVLLAGMAGEHHENGLLFFKSHWFDWIVAGDEKSGIFNAAAGAFLDPLSSVMLAVVCGIGFLITVFAKGYMQGETGYFRFFAYLGLFIFAMTILVMGDNLIALYLGWEGVGLCSYLLIGYYYEKPAAREAAKKAFIVNRIGDFGFAIGILLTFYSFGTVSFFGEGPGTGTGFLDKALAVATSGATQDWAFKAIPFFLMLGAFGKSAQFPLYVWLPDAMEGPTPVSALIHAATMVTAGIYMIVRLSSLFVGNTCAMTLIAVVGAFTAIFAATIALRQTDLKKVFAYSTVSQLGFMFVAVGVIAPTAAVFHLVTHAFFKALLFLSSGVVMHATGGELDMNKMSGMKHKLPKTRMLILIGCLALAGFPLFSGFWSKDEIVHAAGMKSILFTIVLLLTAVMTAYYTFRLYFRVFEGPEVVPHGAHGHHDAEGDHAAEHHHNHEPASMMLPLFILAIGAVFAGVINLPFTLGLHDHSLGHFLAQSPSFSYAAKIAEVVNGPLSDTQREGLGLEVVNHEVEVAPLIIGGAAAIIGIALAYVLHLQNRQKAGELANTFGVAARVLDAKYWVDELYQGLIVEPLRALGRLLWWFDRVVVGGVVFTVGVIPQLLGAGLKFGTQRGYLQGYAVSMLACLALILLWMFM